ncbi:hypothetical protein FA10DRAFT_304618 [Acaromyces ingoldii]|uniref:Zn(2)-C6 fungal-type domain-containing protein n=1 Tax=Acaromyces ingoldii TaxID=215250 RepID=A0A316YGJ3_9BASI|nr:hypothetical protein FA10DRAFT_304618 [Acaromyces ingoldii]PWN87223.1 hypothetical protein FA10DRAFT_304618 [Acaromyces ingoldii]
MERPTTATTVEPRQRILKACASCSARKTKCDGREGGCSSCAKLGLECVYVSSGKKRGPPKGSPARGGPPRKNKAPTLAPSSSSASVSSLFDQLDAKPWASVGGGATTSTSPPSSSSTSYSLQQQQQQQQQQPHPQSQPHLQSHSQSQPLLQPQQQQLQSQLSLPAGAIEALLLVYETFIHPHWPVVYLPALGSLRILEQRSPLLFDAILTISAANSSDPSMMRLSDGMVEAVRRRILDCLTDAATLNRIEVIQSMILISLVDLGSGRSSMAYQFGGMACRMALDMNLHVQTAPPKDKSRRRRGLDERSAPGRGSSSSSSSLRDGGSSSSSSNHQTTSSSQEARRTMWACYVLDKVLAAVLQRPPAMRQQDIDVDKPSTMERDEVDLPWRAEGLARVRFLHPQAYGAMEHLRSHALSSFSAWCDVMAILERILDDVYRPRSRRRRHDHHHHHHHRHQHQSFHGHDQHQHPLGHDEPPRDDEAAVARLDDELRRWRRGLPDHLQWGDDGAAEEHVDVGLQVLTLRGWYYTCVLLLHRPRLPLSLDESCSDLEAIDALQQLRGATRSSGSSGGSNHLQRDPASSHRMASPVTGATEAATSICVIMEAYEATFKVLKFPASWVYLIFQAATVHAGLAAAGNAASQEARRRLQQCIAWLEQISQTWRSASHHVETLNRLLAVGARTRTRPPSPDVAAPTYVGVIDPLLATAATANAANTPTPPTGAAGAAGAADDGAASWNLFWSSMPTTSEDASLWQGFSDLFPQQQQQPQQQPPPPPQPQRQQPPLQIVS